mgnify:CR=1 FL=1
MTLNLGNFFIPFFFLSFTHYVDLIFVYNLSNSRIASIGKGCQKKVSKLQKKAKEDVVPGMSCIEFNSIFCCENINQITIFR